MRRYELTCHRLMCWRKRWSALCLVMLYNEKDEKLIVCGQMYLYIYGWREEATRREGARLCAV